MNPVEDLVRAATRAQADTMRDVRAFRLPPAPQAAPRLRSGSRARRARHWKTWLAPVTAAAAVLAIGVALVIVRGILNGPAVPPRAHPSASAVPPYYVTLAEPSGWYAYAPLTGASLPMTKLIVGATLTGKRLATITPPRGATFRGVTGAADDRTFVVDTTPNVAPSENGTPFYGTPRTWYLLRVSPGTAPGYRLTRLPIPVTPAGAGIRGIALSPDGGELAVVLQPGGVRDSRAPVQLRLYSVATGALLRTWSTTASDDLFGGADTTGPDSNLAVSWADGDHALAYGDLLTGVASTTGAAAVHASARIMLLDTARPSGDLLAASRVAVTVQTGVPLPSGSGCQGSTLFEVVVSGDGESLVCGAVSGLGPAPAPRHGYCTTGTARDRLAFLRYSLTTGKLASTVAGYETKCYPPAVDIEPLWASASGSALIGLLNLGQAAPPAKPARDGEFGIFSHGTFTPLPWPTAITGILDPVAW